MANQANIRLEPLTKSSFLRIVVPSRCYKSRCKYSLEIQVTYIPLRVLERFHRGEAFDNWYCNSVGL